MPGSRLFLFLFLCLQACYGLAVAQGPANEGNLLQVLETVISKTKQHSLYRTKVNWPVLQQKILPPDHNRISKPEFEQAVKLIFQEMNDPHATLLFMGKRIIQGPAKSIKIRQALINPFHKGGITVKTALLEKNYGYILIPGGSKNDSKTLQRLQDSLCSLDPGKLKGIIVDLRLNEGGSIYPLASLNQLYGSNLIGYNADLNGTLQGSWKVKNGKYYQNDRVVAAVETKCRANKQIRIAVLTSQLTASSGEIMAVAFKGRPHTIFIGEDTYGLTTLNTEFNIGAGYYLAFSSAYLADRTGKTYSQHVSPDLRIIEGDDFENLLQDLKVKAALEWFKY